MVFGMDGFAVSTVARWRFALIVMGRLRRAFGCATVIGICSALIVGDAGSCLVHTGQRCEFPGSQSCVSSSSRSILRSEELACQASQWRSVYGYYWCVA